MGGAEDVGEVMRSMERKGLAGRGGGKGLEIKRIGGVGEGRRRRLW